MTKAFSFILLQKKGRLLSWVWQRTSLCTIYHNFNCRTIALLLFLSSSVNGVKNKYHQQFCKFLAHPFSLCLPDWLTKEGAQCGKKGNWTVDEIKTHHRCESLVWDIAETISQYVSQRDLGERHNIRLYSFDSYLPLRCGSDIFDNFI